jgi:integrase
LGLEGSPGFLSRYEAASAGYDETVRLAERKRAGDYTPLDPALITYLAQSYLAEALQQDEEGRWDETEADLRRAVRDDLVRRGVSFREPEGPEGHRWALRTQETINLLLPRYLTFRATGDWDAIVKAWQDEALELAEAKGHLIDPQDPAFRQLCRALNEAAIEALEGAQERLFGGMVETPPEPPLAAPTSFPEAPKAPSRVPMLPTFDKYVAAQRMTPGVRDEWRRYVERLIQFAGYDDAALLTAHKLREWRDQLLGEPTKRGTQRDPATVRDNYIGPVRAMLSWAVQEGLLASNVAAEVVVRVPRKPKLRERDFTSEEARAILAATLLPAGPKLSPGYARARRWIPWLCAYTGGRVNEYSQLRGEDVAEVNGIWVLRITPEAGTVKAKEARIIPLHPHLIEQGFLKVVKENGPGPLFYDPHRRRTDSDSNRHFKKVGERLASWVRNEVGIVDPAVHPNHGWRHMFKTLSYAAGIEERVADAIQGHAPKSTGRKYGKPSIEVLAAAVAKLPIFEVGCSDDRA